MISTVMERGSGKLRLGGEPESSSSLEEARHWQEVYGELVRGIERFEQEEPVVERLARFRSRLAFWSELALGLEHGSPE